MESKQKQYPEIITKIHEEFDEAGENLLQEAIAILNNCKLKDKSKSKLLARLGFINVPEVKEMEEIEKIEKQAETTAKIVRHYSQKYPFNKFINKETVEKICKKYNLVYGDVSLYKGFVPADKLRQMADFKIDPKDVLMSWFQTMLHDIIIDPPCRMSNGMVPDDPRYSYYGLKKFPEKFKICAPILYMETFGHTLKEYELIPDPIVLQPVNGGYLIVCAWGNEASDELVVNPINN